MLYPYMMIESVVIKIIVFKKKSYHLVLEELITYDIARETSFTHEPRFSSLWSHKSKKVRSNGDHYSFLQFLH